MTDQPTSLAAALIALQADLPDIPKARRAAAGSYSYDYASLEDVCRALRPVLAKHDLGFTSRPTLNAQGQFVLAYALLHISGEREPGEYPLPQNVSPQATGSAISYARRYALCAVTGAVAHDDDDGVAAAPKPARKAAGRRAATAPEAATADDDRPRLPENTRRRLMALFGEIGLKGDKDEVRAERLRLASEWIGRELPTSNDLSPREAALVIRALEERLAMPRAGHDDGPPE